MILEFLHQAMLSFHQSKEYVSAQCLEGAMKWSLENWEEDIRGWLNFEGCN